MIDARAQQLIDGYDTQSELIHRFADDISHEESVLEPPFPANSMNWLIGHILSGRQEALQTLGQSPLWPDAADALYRTGSLPMTDTAVALTDLLAVVDRSRALLQIALESSSAEYLDEIIETGFGPRPRLEHIDGLQWHETYHLGQLDMLHSMITAQR